MKHCVNPNGDHLTACGLVRATHEPVVMASSFIAIMVHCLPPTTVKVTDRPCRMCATALLGSITQYLRELTAAEREWILTYYAMDLTLTEKPA